MRHHTSAIRFDSLWLLALWFVLSAEQPLQSAEKTVPFFEQHDLFLSGQEAYHTFRIPSLLVTAKGTFLAFCEGRKQGSGDSGDIDLVLKRSLDNGKTWQPMRVIAEDGPNTFGNPCPVEDRQTGIIWLLLTHNLGEDSEAEILDGDSRGTRTVWLSKSDNDGAAWSHPIELTQKVKPTNWSWYATGPGVGIQLANGRLIIPCDHYLAGSKTRRSHVIYSDDHALNWNLGGVIGDACNECQVVERRDGSLLMNMRSYHGQNRRAISFSKDGGLTWSAPTLDPALIEPVCQASLIRYSDPPQHPKNRLLFSNPASTKREKMTVRLSGDEGKTWPIAKELYPGKAAYSCLAVLKDQTIACLYERGQKSPYEKITLARFSLEWLTDGRNDR